MEGRKEGYSHHRVSYLKNKMTQYMSLKLALGEREWNDSRNFRKSASIDVQPYVDFIWKLNAILLDVMMIYLLGRDSRTNILEYSYYHRVVDCC